MESETVLALIELAKKHPNVSAVAVAFILLCVVLLVATLAAGTICSYLDDTKFSPRIGALIRLGRAWGVALRGSGKDLTILVFGESAITTPLPKGGGAPGTAPEPSDKP